MTRPLRLHRLRPLALALAALAGLAAAAALASTEGRGPAPFVVNESPSLARGLYRREPVARYGPGGLVVVVPPPAARPYLDRMGAPIRARLLKRIAAGPGDAVCAGPGSLTLGGRTVPVLARDGLGRPLPRWSECRRLGPDELFVLGDTLASFDSRYFGPVRRDAVAGPYRAVLTW